MFKPQQTLFNFTNKPLRYGSGYKGGIFNRRFLGRSVRIVDSYGVFLTITESMYFDKYLDRIDTPAMCTLTSQQRVDMTKNGSLIIGVKNALYCFK